MAMSGLLIVNVRRGSGVATVLSDCIVACFSVKCAKSHHVWNGWALALVRLELEYTGVIAPMNG